MFLDNSNRKLQIVLMAAKTTNDMPVLVDYVDMNGSTTTAGIAPSNTNGVNAVDILSAPPASTYRKVNGLTVYNKDTIAKTVQILFNDNGTTFQILDIVLQIDDVLGYTDTQGWYVIDATGSIKTAMAAGIYALLAGSSAQVFSVAAATAAAHATRFDQMQAPFRNRIINGDFSVSQINASSSVTVTAAAALQYVIDQWYAYCTGANVTGQRVAGTGQDQYNYRFTGAASVTKIGFAQRMEASATYDMNNGTTMVGVDLANSLLTTVTWTAWYANTADTFGTLASPTRTQISTGTITVNSSLTRYYVPITVPSAAITGIEIEFSVAAQTSGTWTIGKVQFEKCATAATQGTVFEFVPYSEQLRRCQRYLPVFAGIWVSSIGATFSTTTSYVTMRLPVTTRVPVTGIATTASYWTVNIGGAVGTPTSISFNQGSMDTVHICFTTTAGAPTLVGKEGVAVYSNNSAMVLVVTGAQL